jgi:hypothetical protein
MKLHPHQEELLRQLAHDQAKRISLAADLGLGTRDVLAEAAKAHKNVTVIVEPSLLRVWEDLHSGAAFELTTFRRAGALRGDLLVVEGRVKSQKRRAMIEQALASFDRVWVRDLGFDSFEYLDSLGFKTIRVTARL